MITVRKMMLLVAGAVLFLTASVMSVASSSNSNTAVSDNPAMATYVDGASHTSPGNSAAWYKFDYNATKNDDGSRNPATIRIADLTTPGLGFEVYTPEQISTWWGNRPWTRFPSGDHLRTN